MFCTSAEPSPHLADRPSRVNQKSLYIRPTFKLSKIITDSIPITIWIRQMVYIHCHGTKPTPTKVVKSGYNMAPSGVVWCIYFKKNYYVECVCTCEHMHPTPHVRRSEDNLWSQFSPSIIRWASGRRRASKFVHSAFTPQPSCRLRAFFMH